MQPVFRALELAAVTMVKVSGARLDFDGLEHIPATGGAVIAINHTGYVDFLPAALAVYRRKRRMRFMIKAEMQRVKVVNFLINHTGTIPVDRGAGSQAYRHAVAALRSGEVVGVYPEATISRSFELKDFKSGAARMALDAQVPIVPLIVWGAHRLWTKDHPRARLVASGIPITVAVGPPLAPVGDAATLSAGLHAAMAPMLDRAQREYPHPKDAYWVPRRLGGSAPTPQQARVLDERELAERMRNAAGRGRPDASSTE
ncbi:lysophospholipid acyltransferase family protein [Mycolicibacter senuensis]|uniref:1-acyl-sn-glycerol-3-phosphate acyltransferase n=1 Tax=Mycolicibacter senuensis TaxID=386913 RepID=A0A7I9XP81_9MYCO|nr:lysophospholipid acyltransferase family protein [Mycolicibacter senuensis]MDQ2627020.1 1-acyl-sn-glycerol-3-phosphate acyltransferase [Actinomycetota bacterium]ORW66216.1 acyltransferase [Mycolicibacter senuensis]GFG71266.1 1-acyl-sn-glycerol-3-phosphate acyltransferase [Mycolicibacter senuensis]